MRRMAAFAMVVVFGWLCVSAGERAVGAEQSGPSKAFGGRNFDIPDPAQGGRPGEIYLERCASCHDEGVGRAPQRLLFAYMSPQSIYRAITQGLMKDNAEGI